MVLFDAGGTLVFFDAHAVAEVVGAHGARVTAEAVRAAEGPAKALYQRLLREGVSHEEGWDRYVAAVLAHAGVDEKRAVELVPVVRAEHDRLNLWRRVPEGLGDALDRLRSAGVRLGVVSNSEGTIAKLLGIVGLAPRFEVIVDSAIEGVRKPDPEIFRRALARMGADAGAAMYAGDVPDVDVAGARAAGMGAVLIDTYGYFPDYSEAPRFESVVALVDALLGGR